jgi:putative SOS response-associated peptidase YedK
VDEFSELRVGVNLEMFPSWERLKSDESRAPWSKRYNIAPTHSNGYAPPILVRGTHGGAIVVFARWWLVPRWWQKPFKALPTSFNARSEELDKKPMWREPFAERRCLVPATGWREFPGQSGSKRAFHFERGEPFAFAGIWDQWRSNDGEVVDSFAIVTADASPVVRPIHDRMPLVLPEELHRPWLYDDDARKDVLQEAFARREENLSTYEVSTYGKSVHNEGPACIERIAVQGELF